MSEQQIALKPINKLRVGKSSDSFRYFIPNYQRGLWWSPLQWKQLLGDIRKFAQLWNPQQEEFYSLQPHVIKNQRTRGRCSSDSVIGLNAKLLFRPPKLAHDVLMHELCHTLKRNHTREGV